MRRVLYSLMAVGLVGLFTGCCTTHGRCDCEVDDHCYTRQPWIHHGPIQASLPADHIGGPVGDPIHPAPAPRPLPDGKGPGAPKSLPPIRD